MKPILESKTYIHEIPAYGFTRDGFDYLAHFHQDVEFAYVHEGSLMVGANQESYCLQAGEMAIFGSNTIHWYKKGSDPTVCSVLFFKPRLLWAPANWPEHEVFTSPFITLDVMQTLPEAVRQRIPELFEDLSSKIAEGRKHYGMYCHGLILELGATALQYFPMSLPTPKSLHQRMPNFKSIERSIRYIYEHQEQEIDLNTLAKEVGLSPSYLSRLFPLYTGYHFNDFLVMVRLDRALLMLKETDKNILDVALECGFNSIRTFNRCFRERMSISPRDVRREKA